MNEQERILEILKEYKFQAGARYGIEAMGIFGSAARGEIEEDSDVDVFVKTSVPDPFTLVHIRDDLQERLKRRVEMVRLRENMNKYLKDRINQDAIYV